MNLVITVKMLPEANQDLPKQVGDVKSHFEGLQKQGLLGPEDHVSLRFLLEMKQ